MFFAAIAHQYSFSYKQFVTEEIEEGATCFGSFCAMLDISDVKTDITEHIGVLGLCYIYCEK